MLSHVINFYAIQEWWNNFGNFYILIFAFCLFVSDMQVWSSCNLYALLFYINFFPTALMMREKNRHIGWWCCYCCCCCCAITNEKLSNAFVYIFCICRPCRRLQRRAISVGTYRQRINIVKHWRTTRERHK